MIPDVVVRTRLIGDVYLAHVMTRFPAATLFLHTVSKARMGAAWMLPWHLVEYLTFLTAVLVVCQTRVSLCSDAEMVFGVQ